MTSLARRNLLEQQPVDDDGLFHADVSPEALKAFEARRDREAEHEAALKRIDEALAKARPRTIEQRKDAA